jgi:hypothetical protein
LLSQSGSKQSGKPSQSSSLPSEHWASELVLALHVGPTGPAPALFEAVPAVLDELPELPVPALPEFGDLEPLPQPPASARPRTENAVSEKALFMV